MRELIKALFKKKSRGDRLRLRLAMRGYQKLKSEERLRKISELQQVICNQRVVTLGSEFNRLIFGEGMQCAELVVRQFLLVKIGYLQMNRVLLVASSSLTRRVSAPLPKEWRRAVEMQGFKVNRIGCEIKWQIYIFAHFLYGLKKIGYELLGCLNFEKKQETGRYNYFADLTSKNIPRDNSDTKKYDILSWYASYPKRDKKINIFRHSVKEFKDFSLGNVKIEYQRDPIPKATGLFIFWRSMKWSALAVTISLIDLFKGRWWHALLLSEAVMANRARVVESNNTGCEYFFHNSNWIYRPLWTYEVEKKGSVSTLYFYSTNCEGFQIPDVQDQITFGYNAMNWMKYLVWDAFQKNFIRKCVGGDADLEVAGHIGFQSSDGDFLSTELPSVAVFDVTPHRNSVYRTLGLGLEYYVPDVVNKFLLDISQVIENYEANILWKKKRNVGKSEHPMYRKLTSELALKKKFNAVDPDVAAEKLIEGARIVISLPFTSTALIGREMGKPSIYYDPLGQLKKTDPGAHGINILSCVSELSDWVAEHLNAK